MRKLRYRYNLMEKKRLQGVGSEGQEGLGRQKKAAAEIVEVVIEGNVQSELFRPKEIEKKILKMPKEKQDNEYQKFIIQKVKELNQLKDKYPDLYQDCIE